MNSASGVYVQLATSPVYLHMRNEGGLRSVETREKQLSPIERLPLLCHAKRNVGGYGARHYQGDQVMVLKVPIRVCVDYILIT